MGFPILVRWHLYIELGPRTSNACPLVRYFGFSFVIVFCPSISIWELMQYKYVVLPVKNSHCREKTILWLFYPHSEISYTLLVRTSLYWIRTQCWGGGGYAPAFSSLCLQSAMMIIKEHLSLYSLSGWTSYPKISLSLGSHNIGSMSDRIILKFDRHLGSTAAEVLVKLQRNRRVDQHGMKGIWGDRMVYILFDLELWLWPWILKVKFWKSSIIRIRGWIDIKGCESIGCWTQVVTLNFYLTHDLDLGFSGSNFL